MGHFFLIVFFSKHFITSNQIRLIDMLNSFVFYLVSGGEVATTKKFEKSYIA